MNTNTHTYRKREFNTDDFLDRLRDYTGAESDVELSKELGFKARGQVAQFRNRGTVSSTGMKQILEYMQGKVDFNWLLFGIGSAELDPKHMAQDKRHSYNRAITVILQALGFKISSPRAKELIDHFMRIVDKDLPDQVIANEVNKFVSTLVQHVLTER